MNDAPDEEDSHERMLQWRKRKELRQKERHSEDRIEEKDATEEEEESDLAAPWKRTKRLTNAAAHSSKVEQQRLIKSMFRGENIVTHDSSPAATEPAVAPNDATEEDVPEEEETVVESLLDRVATLHQAMTDEERHRLAHAEEEARILREAASQVQKSHTLQAASEIASGTIYTKPMPSTWTVPRWMLQQPGREAHWQELRDQWHMQVLGENVPPPMPRFADLQLPPPLLQCLRDKKITEPTPIQIQGLPVALAGRDMVGIAFTGSGKTLTFSLPLVLWALEEEFRMPLLPGEGPIGILLGPSRELARQTYELVTDLCSAISATPPYPSLRTQLMMGGTPVQEQTQLLLQQGVHCVVATPGRLRDILKRRVMHLINCRYICFDEADRMLDMGFDEEVAEIMNYFSHQRQTLLFSATFPKKFQDFARHTLVAPVIVNVGRAGAANLDVIQEVEYVKEEAKMVYLLHCLQKTAPPVIVFCERTGSVDDIHEYLLLKGVASVSIHGGKDQEERNEAIRLFKAGRKDVLIATDVAAKGLDFPAIQHVINFDMPGEIENYVHRIGRTGRAGKTGVATTFINKSCEETTLLDLKALLKEAKQRIPPVLLMLDDPREEHPGQGCSFCGGLGHTIVDCPKIDKDARRVAGSHRDVIASGGGDW
jgi:ATP-dependent RNA helicase DDX41